MGIWPQHYIATSARLPLVVSSKSYGLSPIQFLAIVSSFEQAFKLPMTIKFNLKIKYLILLRVFCVNKGGTVFSHIRIAVS